MTQITVPADLHDAITAACGKPFATSYLSGAVVSNQKLLPWTQTAWERLSRNPAAMSVLRRQRIDLVKPPRFNVANTAQHHA